MVKLGSKVTEIKPRFFIRGEVLTVKARNGKQILLTNAEGREFWRNVVNVAEVSDVK